MILHSGRGSQYAGNLFAAQIKAFGMRAPTSRMGGCRDNAVAESLFGSLPSICIMPLTISRTSTVRMAPPCLAGGMTGSIKARSASVRSLG